MRVGKMSVLRIFGRAAYVLSNALREAGSTVR